MTLSRECEQFWKALFEWTVHALGIPNEVTNSKRSEIFSGIPGGKAGHGSVTFVLPNLSPDSERVGVGNTNRFRRPARPDGCKKEQADRIDASRMMLG
jgi:hypothetical protein